MIKSYKWHKIQRSYIKVSSFNAFECILSIASFVIAETLHVFTVTVSEVLNIIVLIFTIQTDPSYIYSCICCSTDDTKSDENRRRKASAAMSVVTAAGRWRRRHRKSSTRSRSSSSSSRAKSSKASINSSEITLGKNKFVFFSLCIYCCSCTKLFGSKTIQYYYMDW